VKRGNDDTGAGMVWGWRFVRENSIFGDVAFPLAVVAGAVEDAEYDEGIGAKDEEDSVGEALGQNAADFGLAAQAQELAGIGQGTLQGGVHVGEEFFAQAGALAVIPEGGLGDIVFGESLDDEGGGHGRSLSWMRWRTWGQGVPASGLAW
jgi:hypothetical protein